jgi:tRNA C32,U32 (ribose-2'-O)-methylase TrmJ
MQKIGSGSTADWIRDVNDGTHIQKAQEMMIKIQKMFVKDQLKGNDLKIGRYIFNDLKDALKTVK